MNQPAAPDSGTPAPQSPGAGTGAPTEFKAPWSGVQGVYTIGEGEAAKPWYEGIQEPEIKAYMKEKNYANPDEVARAAWNANKINKMAPEIQAVVEGKATPEQEKAFYSKLGVPETPDKYDLKPTQGVTIDPNLDKLGKEIFHKTGVTPKKAQEGYDLWNKTVGEMKAATEEAARVQNDKEMKALETRFGADLEKNKAAGQRAIQALGLNDEIMQKIEGSIGAASLIELLVAIGRKSDEGSGGFKDGGNGGDPNDPNLMTADQAKAKITALQGDAEFQKRYTNKADPGHAAALQLMEKLFAKAG